MYTWECSSCENHNEGEEKTFDEIQAFLARHGRYGIHEVFVYTPHGSLIYLEVTHGSVIVK